jgi:prevent-host-death family protein
MRSVGLRELRQDASDLLRRAQAGEEITITVSGRPSARLIPPHTQSNGDRGPRSKTCSAAPTTPPGTRTDNSSTNGRLAAAVVDAGRQPRRRVMDLLIAATAHAHGARLYTRNIDDFDGLQDLVEIIAV